MTTSIQARTSECDPCLWELPGDGSLHVHRNGGTSTTVYSGAYLKEVDGALSTRGAEGALEAMLTFDYAAISTATHNSQEWDDWKPCRDL